LELALGRSGLPRPAVHQPFLILFPPSLHPSPHKQTRQDVKTVEPAPRAPAEPAKAKAAEETAEEAAAPKAAPAPAPKPSIPEGQAEIYIGFEKGDYAPRSGRKGRVIVDDPARYPTRTSLVGGWPGGEVALKSWAPSAAAEAAATAAKPASKASAPAKASKPASKASAPAKASKPAPGSPAAPIYVGHAKDDYEGRRVGRPGRFVTDNPARYPDKEDVGPLVNATGGFAGGEVGVKAFAATGDLPLKSGEDGGRQFSPLVVAAIVAGAAGLGGALLNSGVEVAEGVVEGAAGVGAAGTGGSGAVAAGAAAARALLDPSTRGALSVGSGLLALTGAILAVRGAVGAAKKRAAAAAETVADGAKAAAFWVAVFLAVKLVIESS
jgi:hypothetical protein